MVCHLQGEPSFFCHSQRLVTKTLKSHCLLALQLPQHSPLVLRGHQIAGIVLALDPCLLEALSCKPTNKQLKMLFNSGSSSNVISCTERGGGQKASQRPILECSRKLKQRRRRRRWQQERQKSNRFITQNNNFAHASRFFLHFFAVNVRLRRETFCGGRKHKITNFFFFS